MFPGGRREQSKSVLYEFDPFAKTENNVYSNYENNDLLLLKAFLENNESASSGGSANDIREEEEEIEEEDVQLEDDAVVENPVSTIPPTPPRRFDSLPKNEYDEVEMVEAPEKLTKKSPALLPKLAHLASRKQPAVPPRKSAIKEKMENSKSLLDTVEEVILNTGSAGPVVKASEEKRTSVMQRLMKPNMMNLVKSGSKLLSRNKELVDVAVKSVNSKKLERPKTSLGNQNPPSHRGVVYRSGVGIERAKDLVSRAAVLIDQKLSFYGDKSMSTLKEVISLEKIHSIHLLQDVK